jgi:predicted DNA-binding transcriptional regulator YafY
MRADRLIATLLLMQARGRMTAAELAAELEVSVATARRDLEALSAAGVPVYPQPGRGGGWALVGGARTDLSGLTSAEAQALFLLAGPAAAISGPASAVSGQARSALRKLVRALPQTFRADAEAAAAATMIDSARWRARDKERPPLVDLLQEAVVRRRKIRLTYAGHISAGHASAGHRTENSERLVDPWGLVGKDDRWYLVTGTEKGQRTFRVDRIIAAEPTDTPAERPSDFTLSEAWERVVDEIESKLSQTWATVLVDATHLHVLRDHFGRHCVPEGAGPDGRIQVRVGASTALNIATQLAGWGSMAEVTEPEAVRRELARIGAELSRYY